MKNSIIITNEAIKRFRDAITNSESDIVKFKRRKTAVESQYNRNVWEMNDENGLLRLYNEDKRFGIIIFNTVAYAKLTNTQGEGSIEIELTDSEYRSLKKLYFGNFTPNYSYLRKIGAIPPAKLDRGIVITKSDK